MTCGIYAIVNIANGKRYIGKSVKIEKRWASHLSLLRRKERSEDCNRHLFNAFKSYGEDSFKFEYIEELEVSDPLLAQKELYWMLYYNTVDRRFGYNLRLDTSTKCIVSEETKELIRVNNVGKNNPNYGNKWSEDQKVKASEIAKHLHSSGRYSSEETRRKHSVATKKFWEENPEIKEQMRKNVSKSKTIFSIYQYTKEGILVREWNSMLEVIEENPDYFRIAIYNCMNGHKKSYRGFIWKKFV
jgi:group I intron endonuclease